MVAGFVGAGTANPWLAANQRSIQTTAAQYGIRLQIAGATTPSVADQVAALRKLAADPTINVIVLDPIQADGFDAALEDVKRAGKTVIIEDGAIDSDPSLYATRVAADGKAEGRQAADAFCALLGASAHKNVVEIAGDPSAVRTIQRSSGFRERIGACRIELAGTRVAVGSDAAIGKPAMQALLAQSRDVQGVFVHDDGQAHGAIQAIREAGLTPSKDVFVVAITDEPIVCESVSVGLSDLLSGDLAADIQYNPMLGPQVFEAALNSLNGVKLPHWIEVPEGSLLATYGSGALLAGRCPTIKR